jgi:O-antigen/teichoic acid export membrane protein
MWVLTVGLRMAAMLVGVANVVVIARALGPVQAGQYFVFVSLVLMLAVLAEAGLSQSASVFPSIYPSATRAIHRTIVNFSVLLSAAVGLIAIVAFGFVGRTVLPSIPLSWMGVVVVAVPLTLYSNIWNGFVIGLGRVVLAGAMQVVPLVFSVVLNLLLLAVLHRGAGTAIVVYTAVLFIQAFAMFGFALRAPVESSSGERPKPLGREMIAFGLRGYAGGMSSFLWMRATTFLLEAYHGPLAVGIFSVAQQMTERILLPVQVVRDVIYREISSADRESATWLMNRYLRVALVTLTPIIGVVAWLAPVIIHVLFGSRYDRSIGLCQLMFVGSAVMIIPTVLTPYFIGQLRRPGLLSWLAWLNVIINCALAFWLVPGYAEIGGAIALVGTQVVGTAIVFGVYLRCAKARISDATLVGRHDVAMIRAQVLKLLRESRTTT